MHSEETEELDTVKEYNKEVLETEEHLLARLYDTLVDLGSTAEINAVTLEDGQQLIVISLINVRYNAETGFEKTTL